jgi:competence protein ComEA
MMFSVQSQLSKFIRYGLQFLVLFMLALPALAGVNVNSASQNELESLPGIGPSKARSIIEYRAANGPFSSLADLDHVSGIGPSTLANLEPHVVFEGDTTPVPSGSARASRSRSSSSNSTGGIININTASQSDLQSLPGIGPSKAVAIIDNRTENGIFSSCSELSRVTGIGSATVRNISSRCTVE